MMKKIITTKSITQDDQMDATLLDTHKQLDIKNPNGLPIEDVLAFAVSNNRPEKPHTFTHNLRFANPRLVKRGLAFATKNKPARWGLTEKGRKYGK